MFADYIENIQYASSDYRKRDRFLVKNVVIRLPYLSPQHFVDYSKNPSKVLEELEEFMKPILESSGECLFFSDFISKDSVYTIYKIKRENTIAALTDFLEETFQTAKQDDLIIREQLSASFEKIFDGLFVGETFKQRFLTDLKTKSVSTDFSVSGSLAPDRFIAKTGHYFVNINIRFTPEHESFLRKVLNITTNVELLYRGYVYFKSDFTVKEFKFKLFSATDLHREHFEYSRSSPTYGFITTEKKAKPYAYDQKPTLFFKHFTPDEYKSILYQLLKFMNDSETLAKYSELLPELYRPSAYDFSSLSMDDLDTRLILQDMIDI